MLIKPVVCLSNAKLEISLLIILYNYVVSIKQEIYNLRKLGSRAVGVQLRGRS